MIDNLQENYCSSALEKNKVWAHAFIDGKPVYFRESSDKFFDDAKSWKLVADYGFNVFYKSNIEFRIRYIAKPSINWEHVADKWKYLAIDADGAAHIFNTRPSLSNCTWYTLDGYCRADVFSSFTPGECSWEDSLIARLG